MSQTAAPPQQQSGETNSEDTGEGVGDRALSSIQAAGRELALLPVLAIVVVIGSFTSSTFMTEKNILNVLQQSSELAVVVVGLSLILISGKFDLSLESTFGLAPMVAAWLLVPATLGGSGAEVSGVVALLVVIAVGLAVGGVNAFLVIKLNLNAFITTLAMLILLRGLTLGLSSGKTFYSLPESFLWLGTAEMAGVPVAVIFAGILYVVAAVFLRYHRVGRAIYAVGGNAEAAKAAGIRVNRILIGVFVIGSLLAAIAGLMLTGRVGAVTANQGSNLIFTAFAAAVIGGISLDGGRGNILGALTGVLLLGVIANILTLSQVDTFWIDASYGAIIVIALIITKVTQRGKVVEA